MSRLVALALLAGSLVACADPADRRRAEELLAERGGAHGHGAPSRTSTPALPSEPLTVEQLGVALGCTPKPDVRAADHHQATCATARGDLLLLDFATAAGQRTWLDMALDYGNTYLVGDRWVLGAPAPEALIALRQKFGGAIEGGA